LNPESVLAFIDDSFGSRRFGTIRDNGIIQGDYGKCYQMI